MKLPDACPVWFCPSATCWAPELWRRRFAPAGCCYRRLASLTAGAVLAVLVFSVALLVASAANAVMAAMLMGIAVLVLLDATHFHHRLGASRRKVRSLRPGQRWGQSDTNLPAAPHSGTPLARLKPIPPSDRFELFYWSATRGRWRTFGDFGRLKLTLERANEVLRNEPIFHSLVSR